MKSVSGDACPGAATPALSAGRIARLRARGLNACAIAGAIGLALTLWASAAQAQCTATGTTSLAITSAVASASSSVSTLIASINSVNTAFLTQSSAFIGSPPNPQPDQQGGGVWARGVGGHFAYSTGTTVGNLNFDGPQRASINCNNRAQQDFSGVQIGGDFARLNVNGWNMHAGLTTGVLGIESQDGTSEGLNAPGSFHNNLQVPFAGLYGAASYGGFLVDGEVRGDLYQNQVSDVVQGLTNQRTGAQGISVSGNVAYQYNLGRDWYIEPSAGFVWARTAVDSLNLPGTLVSGTGNVPPWSLAINDIDTTLGRLSLRVGTTVSTGPMMVLQPFASVGVFHDFSPAATSSLMSNFQAIGQNHTFSSTIATSGLGTYTQFGLGVAAQVTNTGWLGYLRGDYRKGDNIEGWTLNGGLRYQFVPDPVRRPSPVLTKAPAKQYAAYDWTGFYIGADAGAGFGFTTWNFPGGNVIAPRTAGFLAGGDVGYNYQVGKWVFGVEGSAGWINAHGAAPCPTGFFNNCETSFSGLHTLTGRVGYAWDRLLTYAKVGAVIAQEETRVLCNVSSPVRSPACPSQADSRTEAGWTAGLGYEFGLMRHISVRGEIMYFDLG
ncbi:MAG: autotransporter domain-containing protein, partial [Bradyrhizobiaceae bacterium]|nr:autotransporter domain-containing protein [Bradyrhizobiaceae bacterium]